MSAPAEAVAGGWTVSNIESTAALHAPEGLLVVIIRNALPFVMSLAPGV